MTVVVQQQQEVPEETKEEQRASTQTQQTVHFAKDVKNPMEFQLPKMPGSPTGVWDLSFLLGGGGFEGEDDSLSTTGFDDASMDSADHTVMSQQNLAAVPDRLVDFFCIVGPELGMIRDFAQTPREVKLDAKLLDCYPKQRDDVDFPAELPMFCMPNGIRLSTEYKVPEIATFVLTSSVGNRLYGTVITTYEIVPLEDLCEAFWQGECLLPSWLEQPIPFYLPKCLVVISHHAFYDVQRTFLVQLHRIASCGRAPLPLERYIASFVHDVPLPRPGVAKVSWNCFTRDTEVRFQRPAVNELPLVNFSYHPIFRTMSISNILAIWGILLQEGRVVLQSENQALLTPVAEALTSFLFPFTWQGMYVPVLPSNMLDILDAPVPFLVGFVGRQCPQPEGVVVCDMDQDIVHLGYDDSKQSRCLPQLPKPLVTHLKLELEEAADKLYMIPPCGIKGRVTSAVHGLLDNPMRESYATQVHMRELSLANTHRQFILEHANLIPHTKTLVAADFVQSREEQTKYQSLDKSVKPNNRRQPASVFNKLKRQTQALKKPTGGYVFGHAAAQRYDEEMDKNKWTIARNLYELDEKLANSVRYSFLRFFSTLLMNYKEFTKNGTFQTTEFLDSLKDLSQGSRPFVESMIQTQMFERFLVESSTRRRLFDEHVKVQLNENVLTKRHETPFLDQQLAVTKIIEPSSPCNAGVGRGKLFSYEKFPSKLDEEEFVSQKTLDPVSALCYLGSDVICGLEW